MTLPIREYNNYEIYVKEDKTGYEIVNHFYGVVEYEETCLPNACFIAKKLDETLDKIYEEDEGPQDNNIVTMVPNDPDNNPNGSAH